MSDMIDANAPIEDLDFTVGTFNCLFRAGFSTVADLASKTYKELEHVPGMSWKRLDEIKVNLNRNGRFLAG